MQIESALKVVAWQIKNLHAFATVLLCAIQRSGAKLATVGVNIN
jgi:hypothetical protein